MPSHVVYAWIYGGPAGRIEESNRPWRLGSIVPGQDQPELDLPSRTAEQPRRRDFRCAPGGEQRAPGVLRRMHAAKHCSHPVARCTRPAEPFIRLLDPFARWLERFIRRPEPVTRHS